MHPLIFFQESTYKDSKGELRPCYKITKKGCEFIAHKLTGTKGTIFTAKYINRFHEMQEIITEQKEEKLPWFIKEFRGRYIVLERDFIELTGVDIKKHKLFYMPEYFKGGLDFNGWDWKCNNEEFKQEYGFDFGDDPCMKYFYPCGVIKALRILRNDSMVQMNKGAYEMLVNAINLPKEPKRKEVTTKSWTMFNEIKSKSLPIQINITLSKGEMSIC